MGVFIRKCMVAGYSMIFLGIPVALYAENIEITKTYPVNQSTELALSSQAVDIEADTNYDDTSENVISLHFIGSPSCELSENLATHSLMLNISHKSDNLPWYKKLFALSEDDCSGNLTVTVPKQITVSVDTKSGSIKLTRIEKLSELSSVSGDISLSSFSVEHAKMIKSVSGNIAILCSQLDSQIVKTVSGDIKIATNSLKSEIKSTSGDIAITTQQNEGNVFVKNVSGKMMYTLLEPPKVANSQIDFKTVSGDIMVKIPDTSISQIDTKTVSGGRDIQVKTDSKSLFKLSAKSVSGNIAVLPL